MKRKVSNSNLQKTVNNWLLLNEKKQNIYLEEYILKEKKKKQEWYKKIQNGK